MGLMGNAFLSHLRTQCVSNRGRTRLCARCLLCPAPAEGGRRDVTVRAVVGAAEGAEPEVRAELEVRAAEAKICWEAEAVEGAEAQGVQAGVEAVVHAATADVQRAALSISQQATHTLCRRM